MSFLGREKNKQTCYVQTCKPEGNGEKTGMNQHYRVML